MVVGDEGTNGELVLAGRKTSRPAWSACWAMVSMLRTRSVSSGVRPVVGSVVTSPTVKIQNCISRLAR